MGKELKFMWTYNKHLQYPINIQTANPKLAKVIISQYGGPDGEIGASLRYLSQRFGMPDQKSKAVLNDIGTEELRSFGNGWNFSSSIN
jgi:spore coat protein JC